MSAALPDLAGLQPAWHEHAACGGADPNLFTLERVKHGSVRAQLLADREREERAARYCVRCPVREDCLADAIARDITFGVWGGHAFLSNGRRVNLLADEEAAS